MLHWDIPISPSSKGHHVCLVSKGKPSTTRGRLPLRGQRARWLFDKKKAIWTKVTMIDKARLELGSRLEEAARGGDGRQGVEARPAKVRAAHDLKRERAQKLHKE